MHTAAAALRHIKYDLYITYNGHIKYNGHISRKNNENAMPDARATLRKRQATPGVKKAFLQKRVMSLPRHPFQKGDARNTPPRQGGLRALRQH